MKNLFLILVFTCCGFQYISAQSQIGSDIDGESAGDRSGQSVAISADGNIVAVGATTADGNNGTSTGHVRVFENIGDVWTQLGNDIDGKALGDNFGVSVAISADGTIVAVGANGNSDIFNAAGQVRVFELQGGSWQQIGQDLNGESNIDNSGERIALSADGNVVAIGATGNNGAGSNSGHVRVYENIGGVWMQIGADIDGESAFDRSGSAVALSADGQIVAVGAFRADGVNGDTTGHARVYENIGGTWTQIGADIDGESQFDLFGRSISISEDGTIVAIGAIFNDEFASNAGHARVYQNIGGVWTQIGSDIDGKASNSFFGRSVSLSNNGQLLAVSGDGPSSVGGITCVFQNSGGNWVQVGGNIQGEAAGDRSGTMSLSANGLTLAIGAPSNNGNGVNAGHVRVFDITPPPPVPTMSQWAMLLFGLIVVTLGVVGVWNLSAAKGLLDS